MDDALLREGDDLDVDDVLILLPQRHDALEGTQAADRVHVDMGADREGAVFDRLEHHVLRTGDDILDGVDALLVPEDLDRFLEGPAHVGAHHVEDVHLVEVDVRIDERRRHEAAGCVDRPVGGGVDAPADAADLPFFDQDVGRLFPPAQDGVLNQQLH